MTTPKLREIIIDEDTLIGYNYPNKEYYITNKETTTVRTTAQNAKNVLDIVAPSNTVTLSDIQALYTMQETLDSLSYTWDSTGAYIKTIQLNNWKNYPLTMDVEKHKIYVMNSELIYDLTLNELPKERLWNVQYFYKDKLGLYVSIDDLIILYNILLTYYNPNPYNALQARTVDSTTGELSPLRYSNMIKLDNFSGKSPVTYTLTMNPDSTYTYSKIGTIKVMQNRVIILTSPLTVSLTAGDSITVEGTETHVDVYTYTADGTYTVVSVSEDNLNITVQEDFPTPFVITLPTFNLRAYNALVDSVSRETNTIQLTQDVSNNYVVGDTIQLKGTNYVTEYETLTADGTYTIANIEGNKIRTEETPTINYNVTYNKVDERDVEGVSKDSETITVMAGQDLSSYTHDTQFHLVTTDEETTTDTVYTVDSVSGDVITVAEDIKDSYTIPQLYEFQCPIEIYTITPPSTGSTIRNLRTYQYYARYFSNYHVGDKIYLHNISSNLTTTFAEDNGLYTIKDISYSATPSSETTGCYITIQLEEETIKTNATFGNSMNLATNPYITKAMPVQPKVSSQLDNKLTLYSEAVEYPAFTDIYEIYQVYAGDTSMSEELERHKVRMISLIPIYNQPYHVGGKVNLTFPTDYAYCNGVYTIYEISDRISDSYYEITFEEAIPISTSQIAITSNASWSNSVSSGNPYMTQYQQDTLYDNQRIMLKHNGTYTDTIVLSKEANTYTFNTDKILPKYIAPYIYRNVIAPTEEYPYIYKRIGMADIEQIEGKTVTLTNQPSHALSVSNVMDIQYTDSHVESSAIEGINNLVYTMEDTLTNFTPQYGDLKEKVVTPLDTQVLIQTSNSTNTDLMPNGSFKVDNIDQCTEYLSLFLDSTLVPTEEEYNKSIHQDIIDNSMNTPTGCSVESMTCLGLYSDVYSDEM